MKKIISTLLALVLTLSCLPIQNIQAAITCDSEQLCFDEVLDGQGQVIGAKLISYAGTKKEITIPNTFNGMPVVKIGEGVFLDKKITSVKMPHTITTIGYKAFYNNDLTELTLPSSLKSIKERAFGFNDLTKLMLPNGLEHIGVSAFGYNELVAVTIPSSVKKIESSAFSNNEMITFKLMGNISSIATNSFASNPIRYVDFADSVTNFNVSALSGLDNLPYTSTGYWYTDPTLTTVYTKKTENIQRIYSKGIDYQYSFIYDVNGATSGVAPIQRNTVSGSAQVAVLMPSEPLVKPDRKFLGWNTKRDGSGENYYPGQFATMPFSYIELFAKWGTASDITVSIKDKDDQIVQYFEHKKQTVLPSSINPTKEGLVFAGLYKDKQFNEKWSITKDVVTEDTTLYAKFDLPFYTVTFETGLGGTTFPAVQVQSGKSLDVNYTPSRNGYKFDGWYTDEGLKQRFYPLITSVKQDTTLYAKWTAIKYYEVHYVTNGGLELPSVQVEEGKNFYNNAVPTREGYSFEGWYTDEALTAKYQSFATQMYSDLTLYAKWREMQKFTVSFEMNGAPPMESMQVYDEFKVASLPTPEWEGHRFIGWYKNVHFTDPAHNQLLTGDLKLYAKFMRNTYTVTFVHATNTNKVTVLHGDFVTAPTAESRPGYKFIRWLETTNKEWDFNKDVVKSNLTFTAMYEPIPTYDVQFMRLPGELLTAQSVEEGELAQMPVQPTREGYRFEGWYLDPTYTKRWNPNTPVTETFQVFAKWTNNAGTQAYINGFPDGTFKPNAAVTREQMALMLANILTNYNVPTHSSTPFTDISNSYAKDAINYVNQNGLMTGKTANGFDPKGNMTRAEMATVVSRYVAKQCIEENGTEPCSIPVSPSIFSDVANGFWAKDAIMHVVQIGTMIGYPEGTFKPTNNISRAESVKVLNGVFNRPALPANVTPREFSDIDRHWAKEEIVKAATSY
ncbi:MAG: InlB B-repeat-containing protein [Solibacillus sp.]|uniref:InlB B-repeat-containing protein n=1 Tax=Solibacillus sp. TaxID=1909654 RepID=UPI003314997A